ncbi:DCC1-like thiol-disulfide oxidoreductase family protein [Streptomyces sclerotialus]|uniref:DCC1-like thiol-disulfide oxidoreductase family protein n=1 Tax=Streptomyces sclerotialus TaxID=1957 RepID=UPI00055E72E3
MAAPAARPRPPLRSVTVLYDPDRPLCAHVRDWLARQRQLVPLVPVPAGSAEARRRFPELDHEATCQEITCVGDRGQVYRGAAAWLVCLWALAAHRATAHRLATPAGVPLARAAVLAAAEYRAAYHATGPARERTGGWTYDRARGWSYVPERRAAGDRTAPG